MRESDQLFVKVGSLCGGGAEFCLTPQVKETFTGKLGWNPRDSFGAAGKPWIFELGVSL
jgi:hypothetical protein